MSFSKNLKKFRENCGLTQEELAEKLNVSRPLITRFELGIKKPSLDLLEQIAGALDCSMADLLS
ncbi:MAG: helix-turn-helix transcriptional regulator [Bacillota bacterium]|nr:helix-turn-helix transcriptional regulator [Bacillota bacterium]